MINAIITSAFARSRTVFMVLAFVLITGSSAYFAIPKEAEPDIPIPFIHVSMSHDGISPEDAERLLVRPMEQELQSIAGLKEMTGTASEGYGAVTLEFFPGFDSQRALLDVREKVDTAKRELPAATDEPVVEEINVALFPVLTVALSGPLPERGLISIARELRDAIEALPGVLEVDIGGDREAMLEVVIDPTTMATYGLELSDLFTLVSNNNRLVAAGAMDTGAGRLVVKVPGVVEDGDDINTMPVKVAGDQVVTFDEIGSVRSTYKDPEGFARVNGQPAITLEVKKRVGANIIDTVTEIREVVEARRPQWPANLQVDYLQDKSTQIRTMLMDLQNNVISAIFLVMLVMIAALGVRSALLVGLAIPGSFLAGILILYSLGYTLNIVVLFSLILVVGMLVDGAIVVTELANRRLALGDRPKVAYAVAAKRMAWPVITSTLTTLAVFLPLLFWPGLVGEFMKFLPVTVIFCLTASLAMALIFVPVVGGALGGGALRPVAQAPTGVVGIYLRLLRRLLHHPAKTLLVALLLLAGTYLAYGYFGKGVEFFPDVEPELALIQIHARGDLSIAEKDAIVREVEAQILPLAHLKSVYTRTLTRGDGQTQAEDVIGVIQLEFTDWQLRPKAQTILTAMREITGDIPGVIIEFRQAEEGPASGKPIQMEFYGDNGVALHAAVATTRRLMAQVGGFVDIEDDRPLPGIEWRLQVDRQRAAQYGADITLLGNMVQMVTTGIVISTYRPPTQDDEVDIRARFPADQRHLDQLTRLTVPTAQGQIPISHFVTLAPAPKTGTVKRINSRRAVTLQADIAPGLLADQQLAKLRATIDQSELAAAAQEQGVRWRFKGEDEEQREAATFLANAFLGAIFLMGLILITQFNRFYQALLVLSAIVFSTAGVLLGLLATGQAFGVVMVGLGIIALAGIVVNNNIVLIDTYNQLRQEGLSPQQAALATGEQRLRPVFLTAFTTVLGLLPMVFALNIDFFHRTINIGAPSTQWWTQLASAIAGGLTVATLLTLLLTPCLLVLGDRSARRQRRLNLLARRLPKPQPTEQLA